MRRIFAIAMIGALMCSTALPLWASACEAMKVTPMCHRMAAEHHCEMEQQDDQATPEQAIPVMSSHSGYCPMHCCMQSSAGTAGAVASASTAISLPVVQHQVSFSNPTFTTSGFSSHTDRGPPLT